MSQLVTPRSRFWSLLAAGAVVVVSVVSVPVGPAFAAGENGAVACDPTVSVNCANSGPVAGTPGGPSAISGSTGLTNSQAIANNVKLRTANIVKLADWLAYIALIACVIGICVSAGLWAMGSKGQNPGQELTGKKGIILCMTAAFFVGAINPMLSWLDDVAHKADTTGVTGIGIAAVAGGSAANNAAAQQGNANMILFNRCIVGTTNCTQVQFASRDLCENNGGVATTNERVICTPLSTVGPKPAGGGAGGGV